MIFNKVKNLFEIFSPRGFMKIFFSEKDTDFDVYAIAIDEKSEFFVAKIDHKDMRRRFQTGSKSKSLTKKKKWEIFIFSTVPISGSA
jgi:hypothetical protein